MKNERLKKTIAMHSEMDLCELLTKALEANGARYRYDHRQRLIVSLDFDDGDAPCYEMGAVINAAERTWTVLQCGASTVTLRDGDDEAAAIRAGTSSLRDTTNLIKGMPELTRAILGKGGDDD